MVIFNELRITENRNCLIVDCEIENVDVYADMYIKSIYLEYYKNATSASMPSDKAYLLYSNTNSDSSVRSKRISFLRESLAMTEFDIAKFDDSIFYVIVMCEGDLPASVSLMPCGYDETTNVGAIVDWKSFYEKGMKYVSSLYSGCRGGKLCENPVGFEDFVLLWNALKLAISTCDWDLVNELWNKILRSPVSGESAAQVATVTTIGCGCR